MADNLSFQLLTHEDLLISSSTVIITQYLYLWTVGSEQSDLEKKWISVLFSISSADSSATEPTELSEAVANSRCLKKSDFLKKNTHTESRDTFITKRGYSTTVCTLEGHPRGHFIMFYYHREHPRGPSPPRAHQCSEDLLYVEISKALTITVRFKPL